MNAFNHQFDEYKKKKEAVLNVIDGIVSAVSDEDVAKVLKQKRNQLNDDRFVVSVFGHFSNGKSTFLNALMGYGDEVLVEDDAASTATITRLKYASEKDENYNKADIIYRDGRLELIPIGEIKDYIAKNSRLEVENEISEVILHVNSDFLKNGVEIVDTPGFNSTYRLHTEIALRQVEESDAAIFLFNCEKPGSDQEFNFLKRINKYINRVFFLMNKYDKRSDPNNDTEIEDLYRKLNEIGMNMEGKKIYPISSLMARNAIKNADEKMMELSRLPAFESILVSYLLSDENVSDRLFSPIASIKGLLGEKIVSISEQIEVCSKDEKEIKAEIEKRKNQIKKSEEELKDKKKDIQKTVGEEIMQTKSQIHTAVKEICTKQKERLSGLKSKFDISMCAFEEFELETYAMFENKWDQISETFKDKLLELLSTNIDDEDYYNSVEEKISEFICSNLMLEKVTLDEPDFDFSQLEVLDKNIDSAKAAYEKAFNRLTSLYAKRDERDSYYQEMEDRKREFEDLKRKKQKRIDVLSMVTVEYGTEMEVYDEFVKRNRIAQFFLGDKRVERTRRKDYIDDRAKKAADEEILQIEDQLKKSRTEAFDDVEAIKKKVDTLEYQGIERRIQLEETDEQQKLADLNEAKRRRREERYSLEKQIIEVERDKYIKQLERVLQDMDRNICKFLDSSRKTFASILGFLLEEEAAKIENDKDNIEKIIRLNDKSPEEIRKELENLVEQRKILYFCVDQLKAVSKEVE